MMFSSLNWPAKLVIFVETAKSHIKMPPPQMENKHNKDNGIRIHSINRNADAN